MAGLILQIDAASSNADGTNPGVALTLTDTANGWALLDFDPGVAEPEYQSASSTDTEGSIPVSGKHQNRTVTIRLHIAKSTPALLRTALDSIEQKVWKIFNEAGTLKLTLPDSSIKIFDLVGADHGLVFNKRFVNNVLAEVTLRLPALPYTRRAEADLGDNTETTLPVLIFTEATVAGNVKALGRMIVDNDQATTAQNLLIWGVQSRYYDAASTAALFYQAEALDLGSGTSIASPPAGASASSAVTHTTSSTNVLLAMQLSLSLAPCTHVGGFRVYARVWAPATNTGTVKTRLGWSPIVGQTEEANSFVTIDPSWEGSWRLVDLGLIKIPPPPSGGAKGWGGFVYTQATVSGDKLVYDYFMLVPTDEGSGVASGVTGDPLSASNGFSVQIRHNMALREIGLTGTQLGPPRSYVGDYLTVPNSGESARTVRCIVKFSRGALTTEADAGIDDISAQLWVTPRDL